MSRDELREALKNHLTLEGKLDSDFYGACPSVDIKLMFDGEEIASVSVYLPSSCLGEHKGDW